MLEEADRAKFQGRSMWVCVDVVERSGSMGGMDTRDEKLRLERWREIEVELLSHPDLEIDVSEIAAKRIADMETERDALKAEVARLRAMIPVECCSGADPHCYGPRGCLARAAEADATPRDKLLDRALRAEEELARLRSKAGDALTNEEKTVLERLLDQRDALRAELQAARKSVRRLMAYAELVKDASDLSGLGAEITKEQFEDIGKRGLAKRADVDSDLAAAWLALGGDA